MTQKRYFFLLFLFIGLTGNAQDFYNLNRVRDVKLEFAEQNWSQILDSFKLAGEDERLIGKATIDGILYDSVGVRFKGNSSYHNVRKTDSGKLPFNIKLNTVKKKQRLPGGQKTLKLSNVFRDPSFIREVLSYEIAGCYMPAPRANFVRLTVNGVPLGLYNNSESIDKLFLKNHFGYKKGILFKCDPSWAAAPIEGCLAGDKASLMYQGEDSLCYESNYELKSDHGWKALIELCHALENGREPDELINVDRTLWMHAFNNVLVNLDSYSGRLCHNYYLYKDSFGRFQPIVWDMNLSFGGFRFDGTDSKPMTDEELQEFSMFAHYKNPNRPLISKLLNVPLYRKVYLAHVKTILEEFFSSGKYTERARTIQSAIDFYVQNDPNKLYSYEAFKNNLQATELAGKSKIIGIKELMETRITYLTNHPLLKKAPPKIAGLTHREEGDSSVLISCNAKDAETLWLCYRYKPHAPFKRLAMETDGGESYRAAIDYGADLQYYIIAEGAKRASLSPARAAFEYHSLKPRM